MDNEKIFELIDKDDDLSDIEKRDCYRAEIEREREEKGWQDRRNT